MRRNLEVTVRATIAATPNLRLAIVSGAQQRQACVCEMPWSLSCPARYRPVGPRHGGNDRTGGIWRYRRPPNEPSEQTLPHGQQRRPAIFSRCVKEDGAALVPISLPGRSQTLVEQSSSAVDHGAQPLPCLIAQRKTCRRGFDCRQQAKLSDKALIIRSELA